MCFIIICLPNWKEIHPGEGFSWLKVIVLNWCKEEKYEENQAIFRNAYLKNVISFTLILVYQVVYMEGI